MVQWIGGTPIQFNESDWEKMSAFIVSHISDFENAFRGYIKGLK